MREFTIDISPDGTQMRIEGHGFSGPECKQLSKAIEELGEVEKVVKKPEYNQRKNTVARGRTVTS